jgi:hypothetical protein
MRQRALCVWIFEVLRTHLKIIASLSRVRFEMKMACESSEMNSSL